MLYKVEMSKSESRAVRSKRASRTPVVLEQFSTRLPPELLQRLRVAAPQLGVRQSDITAAALGDYLAREGF
jgi:hypothetical protein